MLSICLIFSENEPVYAYRRYAYKKKNMYSFPFSRHDNEEEKEAEFDYESFVPPDGGFGWVVVGSAFIIQFVVLGTMNNCGILFTQWLKELKYSIGQCIKI